MNDIKTDAVLVCDDDVEVDAESFEFSFRVWGLNRERIVGFFARSHDVDLNRKEWVYTVHPDRFSIVLTKFMLLKSDYLFRYRFFLIFFNFEFLPLFKLNVIK